MSKLYRVFDGITDTAAAEYFQFNTESADRVMEYAENGMSVELSENEALLLLSYLRKYGERIKSGEMISSHDLYHDFEKPLAAATRSGDENK